MTTLITQFIPYARDTPRPMPTSSTPLVAKGRAHVPKIMKRVWICGGKGGGEEENQPTSSVKVPNAPPHSSFTPPDDPTRSNVELTSTTHSGRNPLNAWHYTMSAQEAKGDALSERNSHTQGTLEVGYMIVNVLPKVLYFQVHKNGVKKKQFVPASRRRGHGNSCSSG